MAAGREAERRAARQDRLGKALWGFAFMTMGALFMLDSLGVVDMAGPSDHPASRAVDGNPKTRWSSGFSDPQWITVDLGGRHEVARVRLSWEAAYAKVYEVQLSDDGTRWKTIADVEDGDGGIDEHEVAASGRYLRVLGDRRATGWGYSLWELEAYDAKGVLLSGGRTASASSREGMPLLLVWWPVLLVAWGLPLLIVPKDPGNQVVGVALVAAGVMLQLRNLRVVSWGFGETAAVALILVGTLLVVQSLRGTSRGDDNGLPRQRSDGLGGRGYLPGAPEA